MRGEYPLPSRQEPNESARGLLTPKTLAAVAFILVCIIFALFIVLSNTKIPKNPSVNQASNHKNLIGRVGEGYFNFDIADTAEERVLGLSGQEKLADTDVMLFVFDNPDKHCIWMKDMRFNLDILWFDADKKLIYEKRDVTPATYPENFCSDTPAKYVAEMTAGTAAKNQIKIGDSLDIEL